MFVRTLEKTIKNANKMFPILLLTGPRQVGKTTLLKMCAGKKRQYVSLDDLEARTLAKEDPAMFLQTHKPPLIIDEVQYAPELFSYLKISVDKKKQKGLYWLTGSQRFEMMKGITESLAGRVGIIDMAGLSHSEISGNGKNCQPFETEFKATTDNQKALNLKKVYQQIWRGSFPEIVSQKKGSKDFFYESYIQTYIHRDVKDFLKITDDILFNRFMGAVAARTGQLLNYRNIADDTGINEKTARSWVSVLQASGLVYLLQPYFTNVTRRLIKTPKLYFMDTGLCTYLAKWPDFLSLQTGAMAGAIFETWVMSELVKSYIHNGKRPYFYYYRDKDQREIDLLIESGDIIYPVEIKKTATPSKTDTRHMALAGKLGKKLGKGALICLVNRNIPLSKEVIAVNAGMI